MTVQRTLLYAEVVTILIIVLWANGTHLDQVPVWDSAMVLFPGAAYLANSGFDLLALLNEPTWIEGGPNSYPFSPLTWLVAFLIWLLPSLESVYFVLHTFDIAMLLAMGAFIAKKSGDKLPGLGLASVSHSLLLVQAGYMYSELILSFISVLTVFWLADQKYRHVAICAALAVSLKHAGLILAGAALLHMLMDSHRPSLVKIVATVAPASLIFVVTTLGTNFFQPGLLEEPFPYQVFWSDMSARLALVPDLIVIWIWGLVWASWTCLKQFRFKKTIRSLDNQNRVLIAISCVILSFTAFFLIVPFFATFWMLPRYFVQIIPLVIIGTFILAQLEFRPFFRIIPTLLAMALLSNSYGALYPEFRGNAFSVLERDLRYREFLYLQQAIAASVETLPKADLKLVSRDMYYFLNFPELGYVSTRVPNVAFVSNTDLSKLPLKFFVVRSNSTHGGEQIYRLWEIASQNPAWETRFFAIPNDSSPYGIVEISPSVESSNTQK